MDFVYSFASVFKPVRQSVIGTDGNKLLFANPAALSAFGDDVLDMTPEQLFSAELLEKHSKSFMCSVNILGKQTKTFVSWQDEITLYYIDIESESFPEKSLVLTRRMLSHMRNCISGIKIAADRCFSQLEELGKPDEKLVSILYHYYYRLSRTIIQLDCADKLERREMVFAPAPTELVSLCSDLTDTLKSLNREKDVRIHFSAESDRLIAMVDSSLIELMLLNLFSNCLKNTHSGDTIEFSIRQTDNKVMISIDDNGCGIPEEKLSEVFSTPSDDQGSTQPDEGIGLGLYISHEIVQLHKGSLLIESRENEGAHIRIRLPIGEEDASSFNVPASQYQTAGISPILTGLADVLPSDCYGPRYED